MRYVLAVCVVLVLPITAHGQQSGTDPLAAATGEPRPDTTGQRLQRLRQSAYELEQAGNPDQATAVRRQADEERRTLLARLEALEAEAEQVRQAVGAGTQVLVHIQVVELPLTKLRALGFDFQKISGRSDLPFPTPANGQTPGNTQVSSVTGDGSPGIFEALRQDKLLKVLAEPTIVSLSGRTAVFAVGDVPVPKPQPDGSVVIEYQSATMVRVTPEVLGNRVRLALHCRLAELDQKHTVRVGQQTVPCVGTLEFDTPRAEMNSGETLVLGGLTSQVRVGETCSEVATYILVRAEVVQPPATAFRPATLGSQASAPAPQAARPVIGPGNVPSATAHRLMDGGIRR